MKIIYKDITMFIADDSEKALKIKEGYNFHIDENGILIIDGMGTGGKNRYQIQKKINKATTIDDLKKILTQIVDLMDVQ